MIEFKEKALSLLASMEDTDVKKALVCYLDYVVERENKFVFYTIKTEYLSKFLLYPVIQKRSEELFSLYREQVLRFVLYNGYINRIPLKRTSFLRL